MSRDRRGYRRYVGTPTIYTTPWADRWFDIYEWRHVRAVVHEPEVTISARSAMGPFVATAGTRRATGRTIRAAVDALATTLAP